MTQPSYTDIRNLEEESETDTLYYDEESEGDEEGEAADEVGEAESDDEGEAADEAGDADESILERAKKECQRLYEKFSNEQLDRPAITLDDLMEDYSTKPPDLTFYKRLIGKVNSVEDIGSHTNCRSHIPSCLYCDIPDVQKMMTVEKILEALTPYLEQSNGVVVGSFVMHLYDKNIGFNDIDIYVHESAPLPKGKIHLIFRPRVDNGIGEVRTYNFSKFPSIRVQIIRCKEDPFHIIDNFDIDVCKLFWNPKTRLGGNPPERVESLMNRVSEYNFRPFNEFIGNNGERHLTLNACRRMIKYMNRGFSLIVRNRTSHFNGGLITFDHIQRWYMRSYVTDVERLEYYDHVTDDQLLYFYFFSMRKLSYYSCMYPNSETVLHAFNFTRQTKENYKHKVVTNVIRNNKEFVDLIKRGGESTTQKFVLSSFEAGEDIWLSADRMSYVTHPFVSQFRLEIVNMRGRFIRGYYNRKELYKDMTDCLEAMKKVGSVEGIRIRCHGYRGFARKPTVFKDMSSRETVAVIHGMVTSMLQGRIFLAGGAMLYMIGADEKFPRDFDYYVMDDTNVVFTKTKFELGPYKNCWFQHINPYSGSNLENKHIRYINRYVLTIGRIRTKLEIQLITLKPYYRKFRLTPAELGFDIDICGINWGLGENLDEALERQRKLVDKALSKKADFKPETWNVFIRREKYSHISGGVMLTPKKIQRVIKYLDKGYELTWGDRILTHDLIKTYMPISIDNPEERAAEYQRRISMK